MQGKITYDTRDKLYGLAIPGTCNSGMSASTTTIVAGELAGYGDDYFNTHYYIQVIKNANSVGNAPESEIRAITDYVSASGTFTCDAFSANVEEEDELYILHSSIMLILSEMPDVGDWVLGDYDLFETDDADGNNERWDVGYISGAANGSAAIASGVYTVNALRTGAGVARYAGNKALPFYADFFRVTTDLDCTFGATDSATAKAIGILISAGTAYDSNNYIAVERQKGTSIDRIQMRYSLNGGAESTTSVAITDDEIAFKIERLGQTWACFYSTIQYEEGFQDWQKIGEMEDPSNYMSNQFTYYMEAFNGAAGDATETASGDFDNFYYWLGTGGGSQYVAGDYDSTWVSPDIDGSVFERIEAIQKAIHITDAAVLTGFEEDGSGATVFNTTVAKYGTETTGGSASVVVDSANLGQSDNYWIGSWIVWLDGNNAGQARPIYDSDQSSTNLSVSPAFGAVTVIGDKFAILTRNKHPIAGLDATTNLFPDDVVGNKTDTADYTYNATTSSMVRLIKGILGSRVVGEGTFTTGGTTTAIDTSRSEGDDYWNGCLLMPVAGDAAFQPRLIVDYDSGTDTFTLDADHPFAPATTTDLYVILAAQGSLVTGADSTNNYTVMDAVGNKTDAVDPMTGANISLMAYMKGQVARGMSIIKGTVTSVTGTPKTIFASTDLAGFGDDFFNEEFSLQILQGTNNDGVTREITGYTSSTGTFTVATFVGDVTVGDEIAILHKTQLLLVPTAAADMTAEVPDGSPFSRMLTSDADTSGYDLADDSLEALSDKQGDTDQLTSPTRPTWDDANDWWEGNQLQLLQEIARQLTAGDSTALANFAEMPEDHTLARFLRGKGTTADAFWAPETAGNFDLDGSLMHKLSALINGLGIVDGAETGFEDDKSGARLYDVLVSHEGLTTAAGDTTSVIDSGLSGYNADDLNGLQLIMISGTAAGQVRTIVDFDGTNDITVEPAMRGASGDGSIYVITNFKSADWIVGDNNASNAYDSSTVTADDDGSVLERLEHLKTMLVIGEGTLTTSSATVPADTDRTEGNNYFNGCLLMTLTGDVAFQPRRIVDYAVTTDVFTIDPSNPFTAATGQVAYVILADQTDFVAGVDNAAQRTASDVIGNPGDTIPAMNGAMDTADSLFDVVNAIKERLGATPADSDDPLHLIHGQRDDSADFTYNATTGIVSIIKGILGSQVVGEGTFTTGSATEPIDTARGDADNYWNGCLLMPVAGSAAFQPRLIVDYDSGTDKFFVDPNQPFTIATGEVAYVILAYQGALAPAADQTESYTVMDVVGNKSDAAPAMNAAPANNDTAIDHLKALRETVGQEPADDDDSLHTIMGQRDDAIPAMSAAMASTDSVVKIISAIKERLGATPADPDDPVHTILGQRDATADTTAGTASHSAILNAAVAGLGLVDGGSTGFEADGTGHNLFETLIAIDSVTDGAGTDTTFVDSARTEGADYWNGNKIVSLSGDAAGQIRTIVDDNGGGTLTVHPALSAAPGNAIAYVILKQQGNMAPAADQAPTYTVMDVVGNKADAAAAGAVTTTDTLVAYVKQLIGALTDGSTKNVMINRDMPYLAEFWETEQLSGSVWEETLDGAGTGAVAVADGYMYYDLDTENVANSDVLLNSKYRWQCRPASFSDTNTSIEKLILEWEARITAVNADDIVNANFVMGFAETKDNDNTDNNIALFTMDGSDNFIAKIDDDTSETSSSTISATLTNWNKFRIEVYSTGYKFYVNESLEHTEETNVPDEAMYLVFGTRTDAVNGIVGLNIANVRCWYEEVA